MKRSPVTRALNGLYHSIQPDLERVEELLREIGRNDNPLIAEINAYLFQVSGKRIRPALLLLCSRLCGRPAEDAPFWSAMVEVIHTASLIHDDIVDNSDRRRGRETVHAKWGPNITVLLGDFLYIKAVVLSLKKKNYRLIDILAEVAAEMIEGEMVESSWNGNPEIPETVYLDILDKKTASLIAGACRIGGILGGANAVDEERLERFGRGLGMCFQIVDDWLDFAGDERVLGKPTLSDVRQGRMTLPLITALTRTRGPDRDDLIARIRRGGDDDLRNLAETVRSQGDLEETIRRARFYAESAKAALDEMSASEARSALSAMADLLLQRNL